MPTVLRVSTGTGYLSAAFALMVGESGRTVGVEHIPELVQQSLVDVRRSKAAHLLASGCLSLHAGGEFLFVSFHLNLLKY